MSALSTPDLDGAKAFYGSVFGWETDTFAAGDFEVTLWRLPGFVGGEPEQPVPADVIATSVRSDGPRSGTSTSGSTTSTRPPHALPSSAARSSPARSTCRSAGEPSSSTRRARRSRSAAWCPHEHDRGRQPHHARRRDAGAGRPDEDRRGGFEHGGWAKPYFDAVWASTGRADGPRHGDAVRPLDLREVRRRLAEHARGQPVHEGPQRGRKHVVSNSLSEPLAWTNSALLRGKAVDTVRASRPRTDRTS